MKEYMYAFTTRIDNVNEAINNFADNNKKLSSEGWEPIGSPSVALSTMGVIIAITMVRERPVPKTEKIDTEQSEQDCTTHADK